MGHCNTDKISYLISPISEILALPAKNESFAKKAESIHDLSRDIVVGEVAKASGLPVECDIWTHIKKIQDKAVQQSLCSKLYGDTMTELAKASGLPEAYSVSDHIIEIRKKEDRSVMEVLENVSGLKGDGLWIIDHVRKIQEKAVEEYFEKRQAAKMVSMDVDEAFKQYADEQKAPIFKQLSKASGLSENNHSVISHIEWIKNKARQEGQRAAEESMERLRKTSMQLADKLDKYKDALSKESDLDRNRPVDDHIREIVKNSIEAGATEEQERIMNRIGELLNHVFD